MLKEEVDINIILCPKCKKTPLIFFIPNKPNYNQYQMSLQKLSSFQKFIYSQK